MPLVEGQPLRILHAVRAPVGGIFRHIMDLANGQADRGHHVGIIADSLTGGERAEAALKEIAPRLKLGVHRLAIRREPFPTDVLVWAHFMRLIKRLKPDVLHGHGAKAGAFIRLKPRSKETIRVYTPHGGSLHYPLNTLKGAIYSRLERALMNSTDLFLFESAFARDTYQRTIGIPSGLVRCVFNGVTADEFDPIVTADDATDVVYVGEFRHIKGADLLIDAVARLRADGKPVTLTLAGDGEELENLKAQIQRLGLGDAIRFIGHVKARYGFSKGKLLVVWDNLPAHRSKMVAEYLASTKGRIWVERLPGYAPELNPIEYLWGYGKNNELANLAPKDLWELSAEAKKALRKIRRMPRCISAFWVQSTLDLGGI